MQYLLFAVILVVLCLFGVSCRKSTPPAPSNVQTTDSVTTVPSGRYLSRQDIQKQLAVIAETPPPEDLALGAMCYEPVALPNRIDYICPTCGEKTLYAANNSSDEKARLYNRDIVWYLQSLEDARRLIRSIDKLDIQLDELQFCSHCSPDSRNPILRLIITYPGRLEPHCVSETLLIQSDLLLLKAFAEGKLKYKDITDGESALKSQLPRLEKLLGVKLDDTE